MVETVITRQAPRPVRNVTPAIAKPVAPGPNFFLIGAPKCGTTAMHEFLREHPDIFIPQQKELHFYGADLRGLSATASPQHHAELFASVNGEKRIGETCIWALYSKSAAQEIRAAVPGAKIVVMLRNPVDMIYSLYHELLFWDMEQAVTFERALALETLRKRGRSLPVTVEPRECFYYRDVGAFSGQLERYYNAFGKDAVHVILFEDLKQNNAKVYEDLVTFLGVDPHFRPEFRFINPSKRVRSVMLRNWMRRPNFFLKLAIRALIPNARWRKQLGERVSQWNVGFGPVEPMNPRLRRELQAHFTPEVDRLGNLLGRDLRHWVMPQAASRGEGFPTLQIAGH